MLEGTDACFAPVLSLTEAPQHEHNVSRDTFLDIDGVTQPAPAPRFSRTQSVVRLTPARSIERDQQALVDWGLTEAETAAYLHLPSGS